MKTQGDNFDEGYFNKMDNFFNKLVNAIPLIILLLLLVFIYSTL